jgi:hypothetical protein
MWITTPSQNAERMKNPFNVRKNGARLGYTRHHNQLAKIVGQELVIKCKMSMKIQHLIINMNQSTQISFLQ